MDVQARAKRSIKPLIFSDDSAPRTIRFGPARGAVMNLCRRAGLQQEFGVYESELHSLFRRLVPTSGVSYDIGASSGYTALLLAKLSKTGTVVAFEPDAAALRKLRENLSLNPELDMRVEVLEQAVGLDRPLPGDGGYTVSLDALIDAGDLSAPDFLKIDVDGGEVDVLQGAIKTLAQRRPSLIVETHSLGLEADCLKFLTSLNYDVTVVKNAPWRVLWPELRPIEHNRWLVAEPPH